VDQAFIQHPQHDVDGDDRGQQQQRLIGQGFLEKLEGARRSAWIEIGTSIAAMVRWIASWATLRGSSTGRPKEKVVATNTL